MTSKEHVAKPDGVQAFRPAPRGGLVDVAVRDGSNRIIRGELPALELLDYQEQSQAFEDVMGTISESMHWDARAERLT